jgi:Mrp family chromosome partitioning ATPase
VLKAARSGSSESPSSFAPLERSLERTIELLMKGEATPETKALLIEARRLRSVVANWRSIPPAPDVYDEMVDRVLHLSAQIGATLHDTTSDTLKTEEVPSVHAEDAGGYDVGEETESYTLDFEPRLYSLEGSPESRPEGALTHAMASPHRGATSEPPRSYESYPPLSEEPPHAPYPGESPLPDEGYPPAPQRLPSPPALPGVPYPPPSSYTPAESSPAPPQPMVSRSPRLPYSSSPDPQIYAPLAVARRASNAPMQGPQEGEPSVDDAPLAPETSVTVHPIKLPEKIDPEIVLLSDAYSDRADTYRTLRRKLTTTGGPRTIAITSPGPGEGKTTCAVNLALAMRESTRGKVLLLEANVRMPSIAKLLGFDPPACFGEQIHRHGEDPRLPWVAVEPLPNLHVMAVDHRIQHRRLLDPVAFPIAMDRLKRAGYECIVIDTPPVIGSVEVNMIADAVDGVLFTAITMKSKKRQMRKAIEQILPAPILGAVVLDVSEGAESPSGATGV